jgi:hypothetical protein
MATRNPSPITPADVDAAVATIRGLVPTAGTSRSLIDEALEAELAKLNLDPAELVIARRGLGIERE